MPLFQHSSWHTYWEHMAFNPESAYGYVIVDICDNCRTSQDYPLMHRKVSYIKTIAEIGDALLSLAEIGDMLL